MPEIALFELAEINPSVDAALTLGPNTVVSFIPMSDVSEAGEWKNRQTRRLASVIAGFTPFEEDDVLVAKITPCLENGKGAHAVGLFNRVGYGTTEFHVLRAKNGNNSRFLFHVTQSKSFRHAAESRMSGSAGQRRVQRDFFDEYKVVKFPPEEQTAIGMVLDAANREISTLESTIEKLRQIKQGLLHDLLTRGIDLNGELRPTRSSHPQLYRPYELGWIPKAWSLKSVGSEFEIQLGKMLDEEKNLGIPKPYLGNSAVQWDRINVENLPLMRMTRRDLDRFLLKRQDLLVCEGGEVGRAAIWKGEVEECYYQKALHRLRPKSSYVPYLMLSFLRYWTSYGALANYVSQTSIAHLTREKLSSVPLPLPPADEQLEICSRLESLESKMVLETAMLNKRRMSKSGLTDDLLTGRVRVTSLLEK